MSDDISPRAKAIPAAVVGAGFLGVAAWDWTSRHSCTDIANGLCEFFLRFANAWFGNGNAWQAWAVGEGLIGVICFAYAIVQLRKG
ncbi:MULTISPECIES: hypothetical protein [Silvimonas]|uniref:hypothetical protein n=1 Tax=Silvimonas TaxID=300264 RepID=UPI0024B35386|nr:MULTISPECIES: hypothetical protein [Silvimonas]MDR3429837.1 hypothetical protein [Silvimonas sp.]